MKGKPIPMTEEEIAGWRNVLAEMKIRWNVRDAVEPEYDLSCEYCGVEGTRLNISGQLVCTGCGAPAEL